jgi:hypothetical protein
MSYRTIKSCITGILKALGYVEASVVDNFKNASPNEYKIAFIIKSPAGEQIIDDSKESLDRFYDRQSWEIVFARERSSQNDVINYEEIQEDKDAIIAALDKPANWRDYARMLKYKSWKLETLESYFQLTVVLSIVDVYTY